MIDIDHPDWSRTIQILEQNLKPGARAYTPDVVACKALNPIRFEICGEDTGRKSVVIKPDEDVRIQGVRGRTILLTSDSRSDVIFSAYLYEVADSLQITAFGMTLAQYLEGEFELANERGWSTGPGVTTVRPRGPMAPEPEKREPPRPTPRIPKDDPVELDEELVAALAMNQDRGDF